MSDRSIQAPEGQPIELSGKSRTPLPRKFGRRVLGQKLKAAKAETKLLEEMSEMDAKTGIYNISGFQRRLKEIISLKKRKIETGPVAVMYLDLNELKKTNDAEGHLMGDAKIEYAAEILAMSTRNTDTVARLTRGDEFGLLLPGTTVEGARELWGRLNQEFISKGVWISAGCTIMDTDNHVASLDEADRLMQGAKTSSKDQTSPNFGKNVLFTPDQGESSLIK